jgi:hypothetical protein
MIVTIFIVSCQDEIEINGEHQPVLGAHFFINNSMPFLNNYQPEKNLISLQIKQTLDLADTISSHQKVENARIEIYSDNELILFLEPENEKTVYIDLAPIEGKTYQVYGYADGYPVLSGKCTVPIAVPINFIESTLDTINNILECSLNFTDPANTLNYYRLYTYHISSSSGYPDPGYIKCDDPIVDDYYVFTDEFIKGSTYNLRFDIQNISNEIDQVMVELWSISESTYYGWKSSFLYQEANDDIYAEPVQLYSNVENGLGVISASSVARDTINIK